MTVIKEVEITISFTSYLQADSPLPLSFFLDIQKHYDW